MRCRYLYYPQQQYQRFHQLNAFRCEHQHPAQHPIVRYAKYFPEIRFYAFHTNRAKAVQFLRKPTSTASGARQWNKAIQKELGFNDGLYNAIIQQVNENGGNVPILETSNIERAISQFERLAKRDVSDIIESEAQKQAENELLNALTNDVSKGIDKIAEKTILEGLKQFGIITDLL